jgi:hypothetical protein
MSDTREMLTTVVDQALADLDVVTRERDALRAEVERLRDAERWSEQATTEVVVDRDALRATLAEVARLVREERAVWLAAVSVSAPWRLRGYDAARNAPDLAACKAATDAALASGAAAGEKALREAEERGRAEGAALREAVEKYVETFEQGDIAWIGDLRAALARPSEEAEVVAARRNEKR